MSRRRVEQKTTTGEGRTEVDIGEPADSLLNGSKKGPAKNTKRCVCTYTEWPGRGPVCITRRPKESACPQVCR